MKKLREFIIGCGSVFNISGNYFNYKIKSDEEAIEENWKIIGNDLEKVLKDYEKNQYTGNPWDDVYRVGLTSFPDDTTIEIQ